MRFPFVVAVTMLACSSNADPSQCLGHGGGTTSCDACAALGCDAKSCNFTAASIAMCDANKCQSNGIQICGVAATSGMSCANVCVNPTAKFASACQTLRQTCGV